MYTTDTGTETDTGTDTDTTSSDIVWIRDISSVWVYSVKYSARWVENVFLPTLNYKYILHQH